MSRRGVAKPTSSLPGSGLGLQCRGTPSPPPWGCGSQDSRKGSLEGCKGGP